MFAASAEVPPYQTKRNSRGEINADNSNNCDSNFSCSSCMDGHKNENGIGGSDCRNGAMAADNRRTNETAIAVYAAWLYSRCDCPFYYLYNKGKAREGRWSYAVGTWHRLWAGKHYACLGNCSDYGSSIWNATAGHEKGNEKDRIALCAISILGVCDMSMDKRVKGSYTIEAVFICPLICLLLCLVISGTLALYDKVKVHGEKCILELAQITPASELIRMERVVGNLWEGITEDAG